MRYARFMHKGRAALGVVTARGVQLLEDDSLEALLQRGVDLTHYAGKEAYDPIHIEQHCYLPLMSQPGKIICVGLNYTEHSKESSYAQPDWPALFIRVNSSLTAHHQPLIIPKASATLDYEGELAVVLKSGGRYISREQALTHVAGYTLFNDASVREYQFLTSQWTAGKNFDCTGAFGPVMVTPDELAPGASGLQLETWVNETRVQSASTSDMVFDVATLISLISDVMTLEAGDVIVSGTPSGVGFAKTPKQYLQPGDVVKVVINQIGTLCNVVATESDPPTCANLRMPEVK